MQTDPRNHVCIHSDAIVCILSDGQHQADNAAVELARKVGPQLLE